MNIALRAANYLREHRLRARAFRKKLNAGQVYALKNKIRQRLATEDYRCRMPDIGNKTPRGKPRIRHKLRRTIHPYKIAEWGWQ